MIAIFINGTKHELDVPADMPLLWAVRDIAGLTGTKFGCGQALCGACTVHMNGIPVRSCSVAVGDVAGQKITTVEGLTHDGKPHPVQAAWHAENVPQCGYCQSGQMMSAAALLATTPKPTDAQIDDAMSGNICRCGMYPRIKAAIKRAAGVA
jgi:isoquinoline 1-oxidoreductase alpha subunit